MAETLDRVYDRGNVPSHRGEGAHGMVLGVAASGDLASWPTRGIHCDTAGTIDLMMDDGQVNTGVVVVAGLDYSWHLRQFTAAGGGAVIRLLY